MKKIKVFPLLILVPMLASCGLSKPSSPKFADVGKEVKFDKFQTDLMEASGKAIFNSEKALPSGILKSKKAILSTTILKRGKETLMDYNVLRNENSELKYDKENKIVKEIVEDKSEAQSKTQTEKASEVDNVKTTRVYQEGEKDKKKYVLEVRPDLKEVYKEADLSGTKIAAYLDTFVKVNVGSTADNIFNEIFMQYAASDEKEKKNYKFYENDQIFTIEYKSELEEDVKDDDEKVFLKRTTIQETKVQVELNDKKPQFKEWTNYKITGEYTRDFDAFKKGDSGEAVQQGSLEYSYEVKDVKLKAVDVSKFVYMGEAW